MQIKAMDVTGKIYETNHISDEEMLSEQKPGTTMEDVLESVYDMVTNFKKLNYLAIEDASGAKYYLNPSNIVWVQVIEG